MPYSPRKISATFVGARAAACLAVLMITLRAAPLLAAPAMDGQAPTLLGVHYLPASSSTVPAWDDSGRFDARVLAPHVRTGVVHLHGGAFSLVNASATSATLGARVGTNMGAPLVLGVMADWIYRAKSIYGLADVGLPGLEPKRVLSTNEAHLVPAMAFLQVTLTQKYPLVPYMGVGAGYEWLILRTIDYRTESHRSITYGNWAWQPYAGMGLKVSNEVRVDGEAFYNAGHLVRDVYDADGARGREVVDVEGAGVRVGLSIGY